jgi:tRNA threonylcarbamoyl adenosine modification protein YjeE
VSGENPSSISQIVEAKTLVQLGHLALEWAAPELFMPIPKLIFLRGEMGSGKTSFVSKVADVLGSSEAASPSFALHTRYEGIRGTIDHFDLDRLNSADDLESIGFWDLLQEVRDDIDEAAKRFVMIEWAKRLDEFGAGTEGAAWTKGFRCWSFQFEGPPNWQICSRRIT